MSVCVWVCVEGVVVEVQINSNCCKYCMFMCKHTGRRSAAPQRWNSIALSVLWSIMHGRPSPGEEKGPPKAPEASDTFHFMLKVGGAAKTSLQSTAAGSGRIQALIVATASFHAAVMNRCLLQRRVKDNPILSVTRFRLQPVASTKMWRQDNRTSIVVEDLMTVYTKLFSTNSITDVMCRVKYYFNILPLKCDVNSLSSLVRGPWMWSSLYEINLHQHASFKSSFQTLWSFIWSYMTGQKLMHYFVIGWN